ncbi:MAG: ferredoxin family protein, partial [Burkholderiaceae bacterium]|nr:ferredoxin family protein [Burkholderiaceae bacterium]
MGSSYADLLLYAVPLAVFLVLYFRRRGKHLRRHEEVFEESRESGLSEPVSLHPVIDPLRCIGSSSCVRACPEGSLGIIDGKARLVNPSACIGHGACMASCPMEAI